jgi:hypothetical protein
MRGGERAGNRTPNLGIKSPLLCQLSYAPPAERREPARARQGPIRFGSNFRRSHFVDLVPKTTTTGSFDAKPISHVKSNLAVTWQWLHGTIRTLDPIATTSPGLSACKAKRCDNTAFC